MSTFQIFKPTSNALAEGFQIQDPPVQSEQYKCCNRES